MVDFKKKKRLSLFALLVALLLPLYDAPQAFESFSGANRQPITILFIGNSLTAANDLPGVLRQFAAASKPPVEIVTHAITPGGALLMDHWLNNNTRAKLGQLKPNALILQGQSVEPVYGTANFIEYGKRLKLDADNAGARTILLGSWARPTKDPFYQNPSSGGSPAEMQIRLNKAYADLAEQIHAGLAPVGVAWQVAQREYPDIELLDGSQHPSKAGTYLAAAVIFHAIFPEAKVSSGYYGDLPKSVALKLQRAAAEVAIVMAPLPSR